MKLSDLEKALSPAVIAAREEDREILGVYACGNDRAALFRGEHALCFFVELREFGEN